jgi:phosphohistidine phosphatase
MQLYLVQHAHAKSEAEDPSRPLTDAGKRTIAKVAAFVKKLNISVVEIRHSTKLRAKQTAEVLAEQLAPPNGLIEKSGLAPNDDVKPLVAELQTTDVNLMIVGHLPHLSRLVSSLICYNEEIKIVDFQMGGIVRLDRDVAGVWAVKWVLVPEFIENIV